jgi:amino acid transporter
MAAEPGMRGSAQPQVFTRKASGLVRVMSPRSALVYNILTMGVIFPWVFLEAPTAFQGSNLIIGILLAFVLELPLALSYAWLATALPRSGGDYVFQSRTFGGGIGFTIVFSLFVIWILQWVALSGWLMSTLGIAPLLLGLSVALHAGSLATAAAWVTAAHGIITISIANAVLALVLLTSGFRNYVRLQYVMFAAVLLSLVIMLILFFANNPASFQGHLNSFAAVSTGTKNFYAQAVAAAQHAGVNLHASFTLWGTLMVAPIAWTSLQWATYSVEQGSEIKSAGVFRNQALILIGSLIATALLLMLLAWGLTHAVGHDGLTVASAGYWEGVSQATLNGTILMPNLLAIVLTASPVLIILISIGYILNSFQIVCNCYIGCTRIMVAQAIDGLLPDWFAAVSKRFRTPVNAHVAYFLASVPVIFAYNLVSDWSTKWALGVTFANGLTLTLSGLAAALLPYRAKAIYEASPGARYKVAGIPLVTLLGGLGFAFGMFQVICFLSVTGLGLSVAATGTTPYLLVIGSLLLGAIVYWLMRITRARKGVDVRYAFSNVPVE